MRIAWLIDCIAGGGGTVLYQLVAGLPRCQHIVVTNALQRSSRSMEHQIKGTQSDTLVLRTAFKTGSEQTSLIAKLRSLCPDIIVCHWWVNSSVEELSLALHEQVPNLRRVLVAH